jgi:hypothetical protein
VSMLEMGALVNEALSGLGECGVRPADMYNPSAA